MKIDELYVVKFQHSKNSKKKIICFTRAKEAEERATEIRLNGNIATTEIYPLSAAFKNYEFL